MRPYPRQPSGSSRGSGLAHAKPGGKAGLAPSQEVLHLPRGRRANMAASQCLRSLARLWPTSSRSATA